MIEEATLQDIPQLVELLGELFAQEADFNPDCQKQAAGLELIIENPGHGCIFVMRREGIIVGMINLLSNISTRQGGRVVWLEDLIVQPGFRGQGIASALLEHAISYARGMNAVSITLLTDAVNDRAIGLYQRHGFARTGGVPMRQWLKIIPPM